jgi:hypothetical protein
MRRIDLVAATMQSLSRLDPAQRDQFFEAFVSAALRQRALQEDRSRILSMIQR